MWPPTRSGITLYVLLVDDCALHLNHLLTRSEPVRLPVLVLLDAVLLYVAVDPHSYFLRRLRRRCLHCRQPSGFRQVDQSGSAQSTFRGCQMDLCHHHHHLLRVLGLQNHPGNARHALWKRHRMLSRALGRYLAEYATNQQRPRMATIPGLRGADEE